MIHRIFFDSVILKLALSLKFLNQAQVSAVRFFSLCDPVFLRRSSFLIIAAAFGL